TSLISAARPARTRSTTKRRNVRARSAPAKAGLASIRSSWARMRSASMAWRTLASGHAAGAAGRGPERSRLARLRGGALPRRRSPPGNGFSAMPDAAVRAPCGRAKRVPMRADHPGFGRHLSRFAFAERNSLRTARIAAPIAQQPAPELLPVLAGLDAQAFLRASK